jgi:hypothetical protein
MSTGGGGINIPIGADLSQFARDLDDLPRDMATKLRAAADKIRAQMARNRLDLKTATTAGDADLVDRLAAANAKLAQGLDAVARSAQVKASAIRAAAEQAKAAAAADRQAAQAARQAAQAQAQAAKEAARAQVEARRAAIAAGSSTTVDVSAAGARMVKGGRGGRGGGGGLSGDNGLRLLVLGQFVDDLQYGLKAVVGQIPQLVGAFGGSAKLAGGIGIGAVIVNQAYGPIKKAIAELKAMKGDVEKDSPLAVLIHQAELLHKLIEGVEAQFKGTFQGVLKGLGYDTEKVDRAEAVRTAAKIEGQAQAEARERGEAEVGAMATAINKAGGGGAVVKSLVDQLTGHGTIKLDADLVKRAEAQYSDLLNRVTGVGKETTPQEKRAALDQLKLVMKGTPLATLFERETPTYKADVERIKGEQAERAQLSEAAREETTGAQDRRADEVARGLMDRLGFRLLGPNANEHTTGLARLQLAEELKKSGLDEGVAREVAERAFDKVADALAERVRTRAATENLSPEAAAGAEQRDVWQRAIDRARGVVEERRRRLRGDPGEILQGKAPAQSEILGSSELTNRLLTAGFQGKDDVQIQKEILEEARRQTGLQQEQRDAIRTMSDDLHHYSKARLG